MVFAFKFFLLEEFRHILYIYGNHVVRDNVFCQVKPELGHLCQYSLPLFVTSLCKDNIKATDTVRCNHDQAVSIVIDFTDFSFFNRFSSPAFFAPHS